MVPSFYIIIRQNEEFLKAYILKNSIKKGMFFVVGKINLFGSGREESFPSPPDYVPGYPGRV